MLCKSCGNKIDKGWKYCPNCSKKINNNFKFIIILLLVLFISIFVILTIDSPKESNNIDEKYIQNYLKTKYNEKFKNIYLFDSIDNEDVDITCDGSHFGTIKGKGTKIYYKVYSENNDIEFFAFYDTSDKNKEINDNYNRNLLRREIIEEIYDSIYKYLKSDISKIYLYSNVNDKSTQITNKQQLHQELSIFDTFDDTFDDMIVYISSDIYNYSKNNYSNITKLNDEITKLNNKYYVNVLMYFSKDAKIVLNRLDGKAYVYDNIHKAWGEKLDDFVLREYY